jgi:predicted phage terminase large subunit-like protein
MGIEAFQAQSIIWFNLQNELRRQWLYASIDELKQTWDKETKIRKLIPLYRNWLIFHKRDLLWIDKLENELERFPRGKHDDIIDTLQMLYDMYTLVPNVKHYYNTSVSIQYDSEWRPILINN